MSVLPVLIFSVCSCRSLSCFLPVAERRWPGRPLVARAANGFWTTWECPPFTRKPLLAHFFGFNSESVIGNVKRRVWEYIRLFFKDEKTTEMLCCCCCFFRTALYGREIYFYSPPTPFLLKSVPITQKLLDSNLEAWTRLEEGRASELWEGQGPSFRRGSYWTPSHTTHVQLFWGMISVLVHRFCHPLL